MSTNRLSDLLRLQFVPRWTVIPTTRRQSVAEHSFRVAIIVQELVDCIPMKGTISAVRYALMHDGPESFTGDLPGNLKEYLPDNKEGTGWAQTEIKLCPWFYKEKSLPTADEIAIVRLADHLETYMFIREFIALPTEDGWVLHRERAILCEMVASLTARYGWGGLSEIVTAILGGVPL